MNDFSVEGSDGVYMDCYTTPHLKGFEGVMKRHSEDFVVTEIDDKDQLVCLTSTQVPLAPLPQVEVTSDPKPRPLLSSIPPLDNLLDQGIVSQLQNLAEEVKQTRKIIEQKVELGVFEDKEFRGQVHIAVRLKFPVLMTSTDKNSEGVVSISAQCDPTYLRLLEVINSKEVEELLVFINTSPRDHTFSIKEEYSREQRRKIHITLHELFGSLVSTHTVTGQEKRRKQFGGKDQQSPTSSGNDSRLTVRFRVKKKRSFEDRIVTKFVLKKKNIETFTAINLLSEVLGKTMPSQFSCAGVKDKKAVTTQLMTVTGVTADRLCAANSHPDLIGWLETGNYEYCHTPLRTGDHHGNHFTITIRNVKGDNDDVAMAMSSIAEQGFVNYFGPQRFGGGRSGAAIALAMLKAEHKKAVDLIIGQSFSGPAAEAKEYYSSTGDVTGTLEKMPAYKTREQCILKALQRHKNSDYGCMCALNSIPYNWRLLYVHSFSSLLWNYLASWRLTEYGPTPVEGDLVLPPSSKSKDGVLVLSGDEVDRYNISDVVLPCVGTATAILPTNKVGVRLTEILTTLGISMASFRIPRLGINASGVYRRLLAYPKQLSWRWCEPYTPTTSQCVTPLDEVKGQTIAQSDEAIEGPGVELSFSLDKACYATVLLKEIMKTNT